MSKIRIDYDGMDKIGKYADKAAKEMDDYASQLSKSVSNPVGNLTGGSSQYTSSVASLASRKAQVLHEKATKCREFKGKASRLATNAKQADKDVASYLKSMKKTDSQSLKWYQKILASCYDIYSATLGRTEAGRFLNRLYNANQLKNEMIFTALQKARDFFVYGKGRYILNIVGSIAAVVSAILVICNPVTGPLAAVFMAAAVVALVVKVMTSGVSIMDNIKGLCMDGDDPGAARYYGDTSSLKDFTKKHIHNKTIQKIAGVADTVGIVADVITSVGGLFSRDVYTKGADGTLQKMKGSRLEWNRATLKENILSKFGVSSSYKLDDAGNIMKDASGRAMTKYDFKASSLFKNIFGIKSGDDSGMTSKVNGANYSNAARTINNVNNYSKNVSIPFKEISKLSDDHAITKGFNAAKDVKNILKHVPVVKDFVDIAYKAAGK